MSRYTVKANLIGDECTRRTLAYEFEDKAFKYGASRVTPSDDNAVVVARFDSEDDRNELLAQTFAEEVKEAGAVENVTAKRLYSHQEALAAMTADTTQNMALARA